MTSRHRPTRRRRRRRGGGGGTHTLDGARRRQRRRRTCAPEGRRGGMCENRSCRYHAKVACRYSVARSMWLPGTGRRESGSRGQPVAALRQERRGGGAAAAVAAAAHRWRPQRRARSVASVAGVVPARGRRAPAESRAEAAAAAAASERARAGGCACGREWGMSSGFPGVGPTSSRAPQDNTRRPRLATYVRGGKRRRPTRGVTAQLPEIHLGGARARAGGGGGGGGGGGMCGGAQRAGLVVVSNARDGSVDRREKPVSSRHRRRAGGRRAAAAAAAARTSRGWRLVASAATAAHLQGARRSERRCGRS